MAEQQIPAAVPGFFFALCLPPAQLGKTVVSYA